MVVWKRRCFMGRIKRLRSDIKHICSTEPWQKLCQRTTNVIDYIQKNGANPSSYVHPYYNDGTREGIKKALAYLLSPNDNVNLYNNPYFNFKPEMSDDAYHSFMVWHRGLAVPRARNLNDKAVQRGKELLLASRVCSLPPRFVDNRCRPTMVHL